MYSNFRSAIADSFSRSSPASWRKRSGYFCREKDTVSLQLPNKSYLKNIWKIHTEYINLKKKMKKKDIEWKNLSNHIQKWLSHLHHFSEDLIEHFSFLIIIISFVLCWENQLWRKKRWYKSEWFEIFLEVRYNSSWYTQMSPLSRML